MKTQVYVAVTTTTAADDDPIKWYEEVNQSLKREHPASLPSSHHATETQEETTTRYGRGIRLRRRKTGSHLILRIQSMSAVLIKFFSFSGARSSSGGRFHSAHRLLPTYLYVYATPASAVEKQRHQLIIMTTWQGSTAIPHAIMDSLRMNQEHYFSFQKNSPLFFESSLLQLLLCARD